MSFVRTDGTVQMDADYVPTNPQQVVTLARLQERLSGVTGNSQFLTTAASIANTATGKPYIFQFQYIGNQSTYVDIEGYPYDFSISSGKWTIANPVAGTYNCRAVLRERPLGVESGLGQEMDSIDFTFVVTESPTNISFLSFGALDMPSFTWGQNAVWPVTFSGTGPIQLGIEGSLQQGVNLITAQLLDIAEAGVSIVTGVPLLEGSVGGVVIIKATGATGVTASATASLTSILRSPAFVGLAQLPIFPASGSGSVALSQFIRGYPAPTLTVSPSLDTLQAGLSLSGYDILYTQPLISLQGTQSAPFTFTLANASESASITLRVAVQSAGTVPIAGTVFSWTQSNEATSVSGATVSVFNDVAQGTALQMRVADGVVGGTGPTWDQTGRAAQFRYSAKSTLGGLGIDAGIYPQTVTMRAKILSTTPTGTRQIYGSNNEGGYINIGTGGASTVSFLGSARQVKTGPGSAVTNNLVYLSLSSQPAGVALLYSSPLWTNNISSVTVSSASSGGTTVPLSLVAAVTGSGCFSHIYFLGDSIPQIGSASALWINVVYGGSDANAALLAGIGIGGSQNLRVLDSKVLASTGTNASVTLSKSGVQSIALSAFIMRRGSTSDVTILSNNISAITANNYGAASSYAGRESAAGSSNATMGWSISGAASFAIASIAVAESGGASTRALGIGVSAQVAYTTALSADAIFDVWNSYIYSYRNASQGAVRVNATVYSVSGTAVSSTLNDFYLGGATGVDFDLRAVRVHYGAFDIVGSQGNAEITYLNAQDTTVVPPSISATPVTALLDTDPRKSSVINAWRGNAWHTSANCGASISFLGPNSVTGNLLASTPDSGLIAPNRAGTFNKLVFTRSTGAGSVDVASGRLYYQFQVDNDTQLYVPTSTTNNTARIGLVQGYRTGIYGQVFWAACDMVLDPSMYAQVPVSFTWNISISLGMHASGVAPQNPLSAFIQNNNSAGGTQGYLRLSPRRHPLNSDGTLNTGGWEEMTTILTQYPMTAGKRYVIVYQYKLDGSLAATGFLKVWMRENSTWLNNGNPIHTYTGRFGFQVSDQSIEQRHFPAIYNWATQGTTPNASAWPAVNNIISSGNRGLRIWGSKGMIIREQSLSGYPAVNRDSLTGFIDSLTDGS